MFSTRFQNSGPGKWRSMSTILDVSSIKRGSWDIFEIKICAYKKRFVYKKIKYIHKNKWFTAFRFDDSRKWAEIFIISISLDPNENPHRKEQQLPAAWSQAQRTTRLTPPWDIPEPQELMLKKFWILILEKSVIRLLTNSLTLYLVSYLILLCVPDEMKEGWKSQKKQVENRRKRRVGRRVGQAATAITVT